MQTRRVDDTQYYSSTVTFSALGTLPDDSNLKVTSQARTHQSTDTGGTELWPNSRQRAWLFRLPLVVEQHTVSPRHWLCPRRAFLLRCWLARMMGSGRLLSPGLRSCSHCPTGAGARPLMGPSLSVSVGSGMAQAAGLAQPGRLTSSLSCSRRCPWFLRTVTSADQTPYMMMQSSRSPCPRDPSSNARTRVSGPQKQSAEGSAAPRFSTVSPKPGQAQPGQLTDAIPHAPPSRREGVRSLRTFVKAAGSAPQGPIISILHVTFLLRIVLG